MVEFAAQPARAITLEPGGLGRTAHHNVHALVFVRRFALLGLLGLLGLLFVRRFALLLY